MPIALPPPPEPVPAPLSEIRALAAERIRLVAGNTPVLVTGSPIQEAAQLQEAVASAQTLSDVVRLLQAAYYAAGYPALRLRYAVDGRDLYVGVVETRLTGVDSPRDAGYWSGLEHGGGLRDSDLEPRRFLASLHADRAGEALQMAWTRDAGGLRLSLAPSGEGPDRTTAGLVLGNPGNRFTGRHFGDGSLRHAWTSGDEANLRIQSAVRGLNSDDSDGAYLEAAAGWSRVTSRGVFAADLGYSRYDLTLSLADAAAPTFGVDGRLDTAEVSWSGLLAAGFAHRWALSIKADYVGKDLSASDGRQVFQRQEYGSGEISTEALATVRVLDWPLELRAGLALRRGLGDDRSGDPLNGADQGYLLWRPQAEIRTAVSESAELSLRLTGQYTNDRLPEQQQWVMGGQGNVEAFLPGLAVGDSGALLRLAMTLPEMQAGRLGVSQFCSPSRARLVSKRLMQPGQTGGTL